MIQCDIRPVIEAIIDCLNLPISKKCDTVLIERNSLTFITDLYVDDYKQVATIYDVSCHIEMPWWGTQLHISHHNDIGEYIISLRDYKCKYRCYYNEQGKIKYGRYYEPQFD